MKSVQNVTTKPLQIRAEIVTTNGIVPITYRVSAGGVYPLDNGVRYLNLESLIQSKSLKVFGEEQIVKSTEPDSQEIKDSEITENTETHDEVQTPNAEDTIHHEESEDEAQETTDEDAEQSVTNSDEPEVFKCPHCNAEYASQRGLTRHLNEKHSSQE